MRTGATGSIIIGAALGVAALAAWRAGWFDYHVVAAGARALRSHSNPAVTALVFVGAWSVLTPLGFPALPLLVTGGALFGTVAGTALSLIGTAVGAVGGYFFARHIAPPRLRGWLVAHLPGDRLPIRPQFAGLLRMRLLPVVPFSAVNYAAGLAAVPMGTYLPTTLLGQLPSTLLYSYFADGLLDAATTGDDIGRNIALFSAALLVITILPWLVRSLMRVR